MFSKAAASAVASALAAVIVITVSVACFLIVLPQSWSFLQTSVSAAMATERRGMVQYPFITWERMSQLHYLLRACAVTVGYTVTASLVTFVLSFVSKNAYIDAVLTAMLYFALYVAAAVLSGNNLFGFVWQFTPTSCWLWRSRFRCGGILRESVLTEHDLLIIHKITLDKSGLMY